MAQIYDIPIGASDQIRDWRQKINDAFETVRTFHAGPTDPAGGGGIGTVPYMWWIDTADGTLYARNAADTAWITIGDVDLPNLGLLSLSGGALTGALDLDGQDLILDADGDSKFVTSVDDVLTLNLNGAAEYAFSATQLDLKGNQLKDPNNDSNTTGGGTQVGRLLVDIGGTVRYLYLLDS